MMSLKSAARDSQRMESTRHTQSEVLNPIYVEMKKIGGGGGGGGGGSGGGRSRVTRPDPSGGDGGGGDADMDDDGKESRRRQRAARGAKFKCNVRPRMVAVKAAFSTLHACVCACVNFTRRDVVHC
jgi:hypothetical protein